MISSFLVPIPMISSFLVPIHGPGLIHSKLNKSYSPLNDSTNPAPPGPDPSRAPWPRSTERKRDSTTQLSSSLNPADLATKY